jgi:hypothetical protein
MEHTPTATVPFTHHPMCAGAAASQEDINKELGVGAVSADMALDALKDAADAEILAVGNGLGRYVPLIASFCRSRCVAECWVAMGCCHI